MKEYITKKEILKLLNETNEELKKINKHGEIVCCGGTALVLMYDARDMTKDIDAIYEPKNEINNIISKLSNKYDVPNDWLNDSAKVFFTHQMQKEKYKEYSNLIVYCMKAESLLALKLTSARRSYSNDLSDSIRLMQELNIKTIDEAYDIVEKYIPSIRLTPNCYYFTKEVFEKYIKIKEKESEKNE